MMNRRVWTAGTAALLAAGGLAAKFPVNSEGEMEDEKVLIFTKHDDVMSRLVRTGAYSPDGTLLAIGCGDGTIYVYDEAGRLVKSWAAHEVAAPQIGGGVFSLDFSPDGKFLASAGGDWTARVWDVASWKETAAFVPPESLAGWSRFTRDGRGLIVLSGAGSGKILRLYDLAKKKDRIFYRPQDNPELIGEYNANIRECAIAPDRSMLAIGTGGGVVLWDLVAGKRMLVIPGSEFSSQLAFLPDGSALSTAATKNCGQLWDVPSGRRGAHIVPNTGGPSPRFWFTPDGKHMLLGCLRNEPKRHSAVQVWQLPEVRRLNQVDFQPEHGGLMAISPDGKTAVIGGQDGTVRLRSIKSLIGQN